MLTLMKQNPIIPVVVCDQVRQGVATAQALQQGGISIIEVTLRTRTALDTIRAIREEVSGMCIGAGTVLNPDQLIAAREAGAHFAVSPGGTTALMKAAREINLPYLPGIMSCSDIMSGLEQGYDSFKFFPASLAGGIAMLQALAGPFADVKFCATGGVTEDNFKVYLNLPNVVSIGGTWLTPKKLIADGDFTAITELARRALHRLESSQV
jgi:2-dehydro-3-deoxyphosphogluconate aldolase/(4S)-4-hydroxy-2-oxoglutarate aldolase